MTKENVGYPYDGILFSHKKEGSTDHTAKWDKPQNHPAERKKPGGQTAYRMIPFT